jgi:YhcH/YjgK/YiaL family protein
MIITELKNFNRFVSLHHLFPKAFEFLNNFDLTNESEGRFPIIDDDMYAIVMNPGTGANKSPKLETHSKYLDIHFIVSGTEVFGWMHAEECINPEGLFDDEKDFLLYEDQAFEKVTLRKNNFVIVYPEDAHVPCVETTDLVKIVLKVKI